MVLEDFYNRACLVPLVRVAARLVLDQYSVAALEGGEALSVFVPSCWL